jgi:hypothetical protein
VSILEANFKEDADLIGKQDPYLQFEYNGNTLKTKVQENAGKFAEFDDVFELADIHEEILNGLEISL